MNTSRNHLLEFVALIMLLGPAVALGQRPGPIPEEITARLDSIYPGWHLIDNLAIINEPVLRELHLDTMKSRPNLVWGDFDGNGKRDYALYIERTPGSGPREQALIVFLANGRTFTSYVLDQVSGQATIADYIWLAPKGSRSYNFDEEKAFTLKRDAIELIAVEKASSLFYFEHGAFKSVITSD